MFFPDTIGNANGLKKYQIYFMKNTGYYTVYNNVPTSDEEFRSTILSIPKDNKASLSSGDKYRGISLFNSMCTLFDNVILCMFKAGFNTSEMQFGNKEGNSTTLYTLVFKEVISHYINNGSCVYACLLDASKAFERVHYGTLFNILLSKDIPKCIVLLI